MRAFLFGCLCAVTTAALLAPPLPRVVDASSHREAPFTSQNVPIDNTDTYAFVSPDDLNTVTISGNWYGFQEPAGGPNFYRFVDGARYKLNIDNVGDGVAHIVYQFEFRTTVNDPNTFLYITSPVNNLSDPGLNVRQTYTVTRLDNGQPTVLGTGRIVPPSNVGTKSEPNYSALANQGIYTLSDGGRTIKVFAGQRADTFFADIGAIFDLGTIRVLPGNRGGGVNNFAGFNVNTISIQVPKLRLTKDGSSGNDPNNPSSIIGIWATTDLPATRVLSSTGGISTSGDYVQVSRLGNPLVNEAVIGLGSKDLFNATPPTGDAQFLNFVTDPTLAKAFKALYGLNVPPAPRNDLVTIFLTGIPGLNQRPQDAKTPSEQLRLNMGIGPSANPNRLGVLGGDNAGFPNGRRYGDDVIDIAFRAMAGATPFTPDFNVAPNNQLGDGVDAPDLPLLPTFPYAPAPYSGLNSPHGKAMPTTLTSTIAAGATGVDPSVLLASLLAGAAGYVLMRLLERRGRRAE